MLNIVNFWIRSGDPFWPIRLLPDSVLQNEFISLWILHESCSPVHADKLRFLNLLILISKPQDIPIWISNAKKENLAVRRVLTWVRRSNSRDCEPVWKIFFGPRTKLKSAKMRDLIEDVIRRKWGGFLRSWRGGLDHQKITGILPRRIRKYEFTPWYYSLIVLNNTPPRLKFFPFLCTILPFWFLSFSLQLPAGFSWFSCLILELQMMFFLASIQRRQQLLCLFYATCKMIWREEPHHHLMAEILSLTQMAGMRC